MARFPLVLCLLASMASAQAPKGSDAATTKALKLHHAIFTIDTHCDTPMALGRGYKMGERHDTGATGSGCQDFPRMKEGGLDASCFAIFAGQGPLTEEGRAKAKERALRTFDHLDQMFKELGPQCERALTVADLRRIPGTGKRAILVAMENGYPIGTDVANVDLFYQRGARMIGLVHGLDNDLCDSATDAKDPLDRGLSEVGAKAVRRMNELGIVVDVSHASVKSFFEVLKVSTAPILASHSSSQALSDHAR
ncbi:MAG: membrane dipeptidase, partial [Holophaga sp.]|nr:membrane dipeptidase [Holophaga sp.]